MMLAVMYGMMPSAKTVSCSSAPPEKTLMSANRLLFSPCEAMSTHCMHVGDVDAGCRHGGAERNSRMMPRTKRIFRRRSGVRNALAKALSTCRSSSGRRDCAD